MAEQGTTPNVSADCAEALRKIAYEGHYKLCAHYSSLIFQARVAITTVAILAVAAAVGALPTQPRDDVALFTVRGRPLVALVGALLINLLHFVEISYLGRFCNVVASARELESGVLRCSYFQRYRTSFFWPLQVAYFLAVTLLVALFVNATWDPAQRWRHVGILTGAAIPICAFALSYMYLLGTARAGLSGTSAVSGEQARSDPGFRAAFASAPVAQTEAAPQRTA